MCAAVTASGSREERNAGNCVIVDDVPLLDAEDLRSGFAAQRHEREGAVGGARSMPMLKRAEGIIGSD